MIRRRKTASVFDERVYNITDSCRVRFYRQESGKFSNCFSSCNLIDRHARLKNMPVLASFFLRGGIEYSASLSSSIRDTLIAHKRQFLPFTGCGTRSSILLYAAFNFQYRSPGNDYPSQKMRCFTLECFQKTATLCLDMKKERIA